MTNVRGFGNQGQAVRLYNVAEKRYGAVAGRYTDADIRGLTYTVIYAFDQSTGKEAWRTRIDGFPYRGGLTVSGGIVFAYATDGNLKFLDAGTGKLLSERFFGIPVNVQPSIGATKDGKMRIFVHVGGGGGSTLGNNLPVDGTLVAFGLPDSLPQPQVVTKEVIKEVPKEVVREVTVETVGPITYAAIGVAVIATVIAAVTFSRRKRV